MPKDVSKTFLIFGLKMTVWYRGIEISKPNPLNPYSFYAIGWWPLKFITYKKGQWTYK